MNTNQITINVNGHDVKITTDQEITQTYLRELSEFIKKMELEQPAVIRRSAHF